MNNPRDIHYISTKTEAQKKDIQELVMVSNGFSDKP